MLLPKRDLRQAAFMADELGKSRAALPPLEETGNTEADAAALELENWDNDGN